MDHYIGCIGQWVLVVVCGIVRLGASGMTDVQALHDAR